MNNSDGMDRLLSVLKTYEIPLGRDDIQWAFDSVKTKDEAKSWVKEYLDSATLLSKEELELYRQLPKRNSLGQRAQVNPISDVELEDVIIALENSTVAIERQSEILETQRDALMALKRHNQPDESLFQLEESRKRQQLREREQLRIEADEMSNIILEAIELIQRDIIAANAALNGTITDRLSSDDRTFSGLSKITPRITPQVATKGDTKQIEKWCHALITFRTAEIKSRVDLTYQNNLTDYPTSDASLGLSDDLQAEKDALKDELNTLHEEISSVTEMTIDHELRNPILRSLDRSQSNERENQLSWFKYMISTIEFMTKRLDVLTAHTHELGAFKSALHDVSTALAENLPEPPASYAPSPFRGSGSTPKRGMQREASPFVMPNKLSPVESILRQLIRHLDLTAPETNSNDASSVLIQAASERHESLKDHHAAAELGVQESLTEFMRNATNELQLLLNSLYSDSKYGMVSLSDQSFDRRLGTLEANVEEVGTKIAQTNLDSDVTGSDKAIQLISRWSHG